MNKKVLSAILFSALFAGSGTFTSCIDTDEPTGIEKLREAKAALILAKAEVEKANYAWKMADAAYREAEAAEKRAFAAWKEADARCKEAEAAQKEAETLERKAYYDKLIAQYEKDKEVAAIQHQEAMKNAEKALLLAEAGYLEAQKSLAVAKATLNKEEAAKLESLMNQVEEARKTLYAKADAQQDAKKALDAALIANEQTYSNTAAKLEWALKVAEYKQAAAKVAVEEAKAIYEKDVEATDWEKEVEEYKAKYDALEPVILDLSVEKEKIHAANKAKYDAVLEKKDAIQDAVDAEYPVTKYENTTIKDNAYLRAKVTAAIGNTTNSSAGFTISHDNGVIKYGEDDQKFTVTATNVDENGVINEATATGADLYYDVLSEWIDEIGKIEIMPNDGAVAALDLAAAQEKVTTAETAYATAKAAWTIALNAYKDGTYVTVPTAAYQAVVTAYNTNVEALSAAVTAYNTEYAAVKTAGEEAAVAAWKAEKYEGFYIDEMVTELGKISTDLGTKGTNVKNTGVNVVTNLESLFVAPSTATEAEAKKYSDGLAAAKAEATRKSNVAWAELTASDIKTIKDGGAAKAIAAAEAKDKSLFLADKAVKDAADLLTAGDDKAGSYAALLKAQAAYKALAAQPYAQKLTNAAVEATAKMTENGTWAPKSAGVYEMKTTVVTPAEFTAATATEKDTDNVKSVWEKASMAAFGMDDRIIEPELDEIDKNVPSAAAALIKAQDALAEVNDKIDGAEDLEVFKAELNAQLAVLEGEINVAKKAVEDAYAAYDADLTAYEALDDEIEAKEEEAKHLQNTYERIYRKLESVISSYYAGLNYTYKDLNNVEQTVKDAESLKEYFGYEYYYAQEAYLEAEQGVLTAQKDIVDNEAGLYSEVEKLQREYEKAQADYLDALSNYNVIYGQLQQLLALFTTEEE